MAHLIEEDNEISSAFKIVRTYDINKHRVLVT
jgi:hypothetical protein